MAVFYKIFKTHYKIQSITNKMDLNNRKIKNQPPSPIILFKIYYFSTSVPIAKLSPPKPGRQINHCQCIASFPADY